MADVRKFLKESGCRSLAKVSQETPAGRCAETPWGLAMALSDKNKMLIMILNPTRLFYLLVD